MFLGRNRATKFDDNLLWEQPFYAVPYFPLELRILIIWHLQSKQADLR